MRRSLRVPWRLAAVLATWGAAIGVPAAQASPAGTERVAGAGVTATLSWKASTHAYDPVAEPRLRLERAGVTALDAGIGDLCGRGCYFEPGGAERQDVQVADLDGDGESEVLVTAFSGGAHCCFTTGIWDYRPALGTYGHLIRPFGNGGYTLEDLDANGSSELVSIDDRFAYAFAAYVFSVAPVQVLRWGRTPKIGLTDVTRQYPKLVETQARGLLRTLRGHSKGVDLRGPLAAYVADEYLLGRGGEGRAEIARVRRRHRLGFAADRTWPGGRRFEPALLAFLHRTGYR